MGWARFPSETRCLNDLPKDVRNLRFLSQQALCHSPARLYQRSKRQPPNPTFSLSSAMISARLTLALYGRGVVGYRTPNIDRIAREGMMFTDYYAENSCTAGRSSFITGQTPKRTGLSKVGIPGAPVGLQARDITIAQALKSSGYATGQFGKNHLGDRNEYLPTVHGFDEFFGNLYHLNAEEEPERPYWPKNDTSYTSTNSPRGVLHARASDRDDPPINRIGVGLASRLSRTPARSPASGWKLSTMRRQQPPSTS